VRGKFLIKLGEIPPGGIFTPNFLLMKLAPGVVVAVAALQDVRQVRLQPEERRLREAVDVQSDAGYQVRVPALLAAFKYL